MRRITVRGLLARKLRLALTALAIVLGVTFVTGTFVLTDTLNRTFDTVIGTAYQHVNLQVRGTAAFNNDTAAAANGAADRKPIPASIGAAIRALPGVAYDDPSVAGYAQFVSDGNAIGGAGSALGFSFDPNRQVSSVRLVAGSAPSAADDVVMDRGTATKYHFRVGYIVRVLSGQAASALHDHRYFRISSAAPTTSQARRWPALICRRPRRCSIQAATTTRSTSWPSRAPTTSVFSGRLPGSSRRASRWSAGKRSPASSPVPSVTRTVVLLHGPARVRVHLALRRRLHDLQHVLDHGRAADAGVGAAARRRSQPPPGVQVGVGRGRHCGIRRLADRSWDGRAGRGRTRGVVGSVRRDAALGAARLRGAHGRTRARRRRRGHGDLGDRSGAARRPDRACRRTRSRPAKSSRSRFDGACTIGVSQRSAGSPPWWRG